MRLLVTDGEERSALAIVRAAGARGHAVTVVSATGRSLAGASRFARGDIAVPPPASDPAAFVARVAELVREGDFECVLPVGEPALLAILPARERFPGVCIPFVDAAAFRAVCDKPRVLERARALGISVPAQWVVRSPDDLRGLSTAELPFPLVAKPARSVATTATGLQKLRVRHVPDAPALAGVAEGWPEDAYPVLLQQRVIGPGTGVFLLVWDGAVRARFAHRRLREKPPAGGVSVYCESVSLPEHLEERSRRLLEDFGWRGVAMVEYKLDAATGNPYLMEINGRFWGSLQLAIDAGVDFPNLLVECASGRAPAHAPGFHTGRRLRWFWGDVDHLLTRLRQSDESLGMPAGAPSRLRAVLDFVGSTWRPGQRSETWRWLDPGPFLRESVQWLGASLQG